MKKSLLILFAIIFAINLNTKAEDFSAVYNGDTIYYKITSSTYPRAVEVTYQGNSYNTYNNEYTGNVSIPDSVSYGGNYYKVTSIGSEAFSSCIGLTSISVPNSVTSIGWGAFSNCSGLNLITIPKSVILIDDYAFNNTPWYNSKPDGVLYINNVLYSYKGEMPANTSLNIQSGTINISPFAFRNCSGLTSIKIPYSVTSIGDGAFSNCSGLTSITIPNSVTSIGIGAFEGCSGLTSITIPKSVTSIDNHAFDDTPWYNSKPDGVIYINNVLYKYKGTMPANTSISIQSGTIGISRSAFSNCSGLTSIIIPNSIISIGSYAFKDCSGLTSITIPNSIISIGSYAFEGCSGLTSITIPNSVTSIGLCAFRSCSSLDTVYFNATNCTYQGSSFYPIFQSCYNLNTIIIGNTVIKIPDYAFYGCNEIKSVTIPNSVNSIGRYAFGMCSELKSVEISNSDISIEKFAFYGCINLEFKNIPNNINSNRDSVFSSSKMEDKRDGKIYRTVLVGTKEWMTENLNYDMDDRGSVYYPDRMLKATKEQIGEALKFYSIDEKMVTNLNRLDLFKVINPYLDDVTKNHPQGWRYYNYSASKIACPEGWRLPTIDDMNELDKLSTEELFIKMGFYKLAKWNSKNKNPILEIRLGDYFGEVIIYWMNTEINGEVYLMELFDIFKASRQRKDQYINDGGFCIRCLRDVDK